MVKPIEEQIGPITVLDEDQDGYVNASGANIYNVSGTTHNLLNNTPGNNSFWVENVSPSVPKFTDSDGNTITFVSNSHNSTHISGGSDEIDGDQLDIDWNPSSYTPTTSPTEVTSVDHLTAHLAGIDAALGVAITDHGGLTGLADDDHTQYLLVDGTRSMSGALNMGTNNITNVGTVDGVTVSAHAARHISAGSDEIDGDQLDIDWNPSNYTPTTSPTEVTSVDHLTAHLAGIDTVLGTIVTDHGGLTGLSDDDHTQYLLVAGTRAMSGALDMGTNNITNVGTVDGVTVSAHASRHISAGSDEIDGDQLDIDWNPSNYTPTTSPTEVTSADHLTAHLAGVDELLALATTSSAGLMSATDKTLISSVINYTIGTSDDTPVTAGTITVTDDSVLLVQVRMSCKDGYGARATQTILHEFERESGGSASQVGTPETQKSYDAIGIGGITFDVSSNDAVIKFTGLAATDLTGTVEVWAYEVGD